MDCYGIIPEKSSVASSSRGCRKRKKAGKSRSCVRGKAKERPREGSSLSGVIEGFHLYLDNRIKTLE
ncbi:hypothetical protein HanRHA438_Chr05g0226951 [Helianthus annuus]|nr:hypothetical protein HanRHA438_Chr05g0226951 [Helianthus annuus]